jgi:hypothetical protein
VRDRATQCPRIVGVEQKDLLAQRDRRFEVPLANACWPDPDTPGSAPCAARQLLAIGGLAAASTA